MKKMIVVAIAIFCSIVSFAQNYMASDEGSSVKFSIKNLGLNVTGNFTGLRGAINYNESNLSSSLFNITVDASSVYTGNTTRDGHLKKEEYFNIGNFKTIGFISKKVVENSSTHEKTVNGTLTIKGISKEISIPFKTTKTATGIIFNGNFNLNRRDFKVGSSSAILSDNLIVNFSILAKKGS